MKTDIPFIGKIYKVINGAYAGFVGECVSYDLESDLPVILTDKNWNSRAVKLDEIRVVDIVDTDISNTQRN